MEMVLKEEELNAIGKYVKSHLKEWLPEQVQNSGFTVFSGELGERMIRVEEELKYERELMRHSFEQVEKRFEQVDKRFEQVDKRFEQVDKRFEQVDKRFEQVDKRFEEVNLRLEHIQSKMFQFMVWSTGFSTTLAGIVIGIIKFT